MNKIDHIGIAVLDLEAGIALYSDVFGLEPGGVEEVPEQKVRTAMFATGDVNIELLEPTAEDSPVAKFLEKKGPGVHHICFEVDDVDIQLKRFASKGIDLIDRESRRGSAGKRVGFLHPKSTSGVLIELCSKGEEH